MNLAHRGFMYFACAAMLSFGAPNWPAPVPWRSMPFRPHDKQICQQNPPDFSWPAAVAATGYELQVSRDAEFRRDVRTRSDLTSNVYNFPEAFEAGTSYWRVRFHTTEGWSGWSATRRFRIDADAWKFPVPAVQQADRASAWEPSAGMDHGSRSAKLPFACIWRTQGVVCQAFAAGTW